MSSQSEHFLWPHPGPLIIVMLMLQDRLIGFIGFVEGIFQLTVRLLVSLIGAKSTSIISDVSELSLDSFKVSFFFDLGSAVGKSNSLSIFPKT